MEADLELDSWRRHWHRQEVALPDLKDLVERQTRRMRLWVVGEIVVTVVFGGGSLTLASIYRQTDIFVLAAGIWIFLAVAWMLSFLLRRGAWAPVDGHQLGVPRPDDPAMPTPARVHRCSMCSVCGDSRVRPRVDLCRTGVARGRRRAGTSDEWRGCLGVGDHRRARRAGGVAAAQARSRARRADTPAVADRLKGLGFNPGPSRC